MEPKDFTNVPTCIARILLKRTGVHLDTLARGKATHHLFAVNSFFVEFVAYTNGTYQVFAYYESRRLDKFLKKICLVDYL